MRTENITPFHLFLHQGSHFVINIEKMEAIPVDKHTADTLNLVAGKPETNLSPEAEENLRTLGLILEGTGEKKNTLKKETVPIVYLYLFLTQSCNLRCIYCYGDGGEYGTGGRLEARTAFQAVDWLIENSGEMKKINIGFFGGEPFLEFPLMKAIVAYARKRTAETDKRVSFFAASNATLLDDEIIAFIKEQEISVVVSFDGPKEIQDAQRPYADGRGSYDSVVPRIKKLIAAAPGTQGHAVLTGNTNPQVIKSAMQEVGFAGTTISPASLSLFDAGPEKNPAWDGGTLLRALEQEAEAWLRFINSRDSEALRELKAESSKYGLYQGVVFLLHNQKKSHFCGAGRSLAAVSVTGDVYLCHRFVGTEAYKVGNVFERDLNREDYLKSPAKCNPVCVNCFARYYCAGGCKHDNLSSCGSVSTPPENMCRLRRRELELAAVIVCALRPADRAFLADEQIIAPKSCLLDF